MDNDFALDFKYRVFLARQRAGLSQAQLAKQAGVTIHSISNYETGKRLPNIFTAAMMADELGVSLDYLTGRTERQEVLR